MKNYNIEGGINFFDELYKSLDDDDNLFDDSNICLISKKPLKDKFIQLQCGHKFNYIELYNDLVNYVCKFNLLEGSSGRLKTNEIRCPYCRNKQMGVLPYYEDLGLKQVPGVNVLINIPIKVNTKYVLCQYLTPNTTFDSSGNNYVEEAYSKDFLNCKFYKCPHYGSKFNPVNFLGTVENSGDEKYYCIKHKKLVINKYKKDKMIQTKQQAKEVKENAKIIAKKAKEEAKQKVKEEKEKIKAELKKSVMEAKVNKKSNKNINNDENIVIGEINIVEEYNIDNDIDIDNKKQLVCQQLLKSGINKGKICGCKVFSDNLCKRHHNIKSNNL